MRHLRTIWHSSPRIDSFHFGLLSNRRLSETGGKVHGFVCTLPTESTVLSKVDFVTSFAIHATSQGNGYIIPYLISLCLRFMMLLWWGIIKPSLTLPVTRTAQIERAISMIYLSAHHYRRHTFCIVGLFRDQGYCCTVYGHLR